MLGGFVIVSGENRVTEQVGKASKVWKLVQYLITNRHKSVSQEELINVFCDGDLVANPGSALRTMVSRARAALVKAGLTRADELILAKSGGLFGDFGTFTGILVRNGNGKPSWAEDLCTECMPFIDEKV